MMALARLLAGGGVFLVRRRWRRAGAVYFWALSPLIRCLASRSKACPAQRARRCAHSVTSASGATTPAAFDLAQRFAAYTDQPKLAACRLTWHRQSATSAP